MVQLLPDNNPLYNKMINITLLAMIIYTFCPSYFFALYIYIIKVLKEKFSIILTSSLQIRPLSFATYHLNELGLS